MGNKNQPDWHKIAEKFDLWLPQIAPVGEAMLDMLKVTADDKILDVASGTGEPALTLARRHPDITIKGVDAAEGMINVAQTKVNKENLTHITFETMPAEKLDFADNTFDHIICRFGVMLFENPLAGLTEMYRVLKPGGSIVFAVWGEPEKMPTMKWSYDVFKGKVPDEDLPPLAIVTSLGAKGVVDTLLKESGFDDFQVEEKQFDYDFASFDDYWSLLESSDILKRQLDLLPDAQHLEVKNEVAVFANDFISHDGMQIPHGYLLIMAAK